MKNSTLKTFVIILTLTVSPVDCILSQNWNCGTEISDSNQSKSLSCTNNSIAYTDIYRHQSTYVPGTISFIDTITIPINIVILADSNGNGGGYTPTTIVNMEPYFDSLNLAFLKTALPSDPTPGFPSSYWLTPQNNSRIKFEVNQVYFYNSNTYHDYIYPGPSKVNINQFISYHFTQHPEAKNQLNCYLVKNYDYSNSAGYYSNYNNMPYILSGTWETPSVSFDNFYWMGHLPHELGHALGLKHTYDINGYESNNPTYLDFLSDVILYEQDCNGGHPWSSYTDSCTNNLMGGKRNNFISPLQAGRGHRNLRLNNNLRHFAYGYSSTPHNITNDETWDFEYKSYNDIVIKSGSMLTITCRLEMIKSSKIIVEPNAKLIIDGGVITSARSAGSDYEGFWQGIEVWGTSNQHQYPSSNPSYQGLLVVKNGGIIENAHVGATNWHVDSWNEIGGVIQATDGIFRNNRRDVVFMTYQNFSQSNPSVLLPNLSYFKNTSFETNDDFIEKGLAIQQHVSLWDVDGINFINCHFSNGISAIKNNSSAPNKGIYSLDAGYKVLAGCSTTPPFGQPCPTANLLKSSFTGFNTAIEATGASTSNTVTIQQTEFIDNIRGVIIDEFDHVSINRNDMEIGDAGYTLWIPFGNGITIENSTGYIVEENTVNTALTSGYYSGINTTDSGPDNNRIYKNTLSNLTYGVSGNGVNHNSNYQTGLQFLCNEFQGNGTAISLNSTPTTDGIRFYQGDYSPAKPAGNTFVSNSVSIDNNANSIVYMHNGGTTQPTNNQGLVSLQYTTNSNTCPTSFGWIIRKFSAPLAIDSLQTEIQNLTASYNDLNFAYSSLIDDGNTESFKENIETNWSNDAWLLRSKLLAESPYLSSDALLKAASQQVVPNGMLLEILLANPEATKGEKFIANLKVATQNNFPEYMLDYVRNNWDNRTTRAAMESQLAAIAFELSTSINGVKYLTKSKNAYSDNDRLEIAKLGDELYSKVGLIDFYIEHSEFAKADSVLNEIETTKKFQESLSLIENFDDYIAFRSGLGAKNLAQLDSNEITYLQTLADNNGRVAGYAQNILCFFYNICYEKESPLASNQQKSMLFPTTNAKSTSPELINILYEVAVYPNPADGYTSIAWEIYDELKNAQYRIVDLNGREMMQGKLDKNKGEKVIDTRNLKNGIYIIGVYNNNQLKKNLKLIVNNGK